MTRSLSHYFLRTALFNFNEIPRVQEIDEVA